MRISLLLISGGLGGLFAGPNVLANPPREAAYEPSAITVEAERLARRVFDEADRNRNQVLNKTELKNAQEMLEATINEWACCGMIGKPRKSHSQADQPAQAAAPIPVLPRGNKVTQAEFAFYVHVLVDAADQHWRELNTARQAHSRALAAQRAAYREQLARGPYALQAH